MSRKIKLQGYKQGGKKEGRLVFGNRERIVGFAHRLGDGVKVVLEIREDESAMIKSHRGYYRGVVVKHVATAMRDCGYPIDPEAKQIQDAVHDWCKKEFLKNSIEVKGADGETITLPPSTTRLDDDGWKDYLTQIIAFAAEFWSYAIPTKIAKYSFQTDGPVFIRYNELSSYQ